MHNNIMYIPIIYLKMTNMHSILQIFKKYFTETGELMISAEDRATAFPPLGVQRVQQWNKVSMTFGNAQLASAQNKSTCQPICQNDKPG